MAERCRLNDVVRNLKFAFHLHQSKHEQRQCQHQQL